MMVAAASLLIIGYLALGALLQLLVRDLATGLGLTGLVVSPAFGYAGVGFPILGMNAFAQVWGAILPLRWYMAVLLGQAARGLPLADSARPFAALAALAVLYALLAFLRLRAIAGRTCPPRLDLRPRRPAAAPRGIGGAFAAEWRRVLAIRGAFILLVLAPLIYGIYYPQPYLNQILRKIPIAVVDNDLSELSRSIVQTLDASGAVSVAVRAETLAEAHAALDRGEAFAVVGIPPGTERDVLKGTTAHIPIYADATYLFIFRTMASGIAVAINTLSSELAAGGARTDGSLVKATLAAVEPGRHPAAADLQPGRRLRELHRAGGLRADPAADAADRRRDADGRRAGAGRRRRIRERARPRHRPPDHLFCRRSRSISSCCRASTAFPRSATRCSCSRSRRVFVLATSFMGQAVGAWFKHPETPTLIFLGTSLPQFFLTGFSWPREAIPEPVQAAGYIFPSDFAIDGIVRIDQLGASLWEVARDWRGLWALAIIYFALAVMSAFLVKRRQAHG